MAVKTLILKNNHTSDILIEDIGLLLEVSENLSITTDYEWIDIQNSISEFEPHINTGRIRVNDGSTDLSSSDGIAYINDDFRPENTGGSSGSIFVGSTPPSNPENGASWMKSTDNNILLTYDSTREKWLSQKMQMIFSKQGTIRRIYLNTGSSISSFRVHHKAIRNITITGIIAEISVLHMFADPELQIRKDGITQQTISFNEGNNISKTDIDVDIDINKHTQIYFNSFYSCRDIFVTLEYAFKG